MIVERVDLEARVALNLLHHNRKKNSQQHKDGCVMPSVLGTYSKNRNSKHVSETSDACLEKCDDY